MLYIFVIGGFVLASVFGFGGVANQQWYLLVVAALLAIGLYSSTYGISVTEARRHARLILSAITIGVFLKALIIGSLMWLILGDPFGLVLGIVVAQIDPLSTARLLRGSRMSKRAKTILASWASFDDPITVIMSLYAPVLVALLVGGHWQPIGGTMQEAGLAGYALETTINLAFAAGVFALWRFTKYYAKATSYLVIGLVAVSMYLLTASSLAVAVYYFWMLGVAVIGLFLRPRIEAILDQAVHWALIMAAILLGVLLVNGVNLLPGIALGGAAFGSQMIVGWLLTGKLSRRDRLHIAFAQQNGITAIILALLFEIYYPGTVAIVAPAILVTNTLHAAAVKVLDAHLAHDFSKLHPGYQMERLKKLMHEL